jgi:hypothetical protein
MKTLYEEYALIDAQMRDLENKKDTLRVHILKMMIEKDEQKVETPFGSFTIAKLKKWMYPDKVLKIGEDFKAAKAKSESTGEATYTEQESLRFTQTKL